MHFDKASAAAAGSGDVTFHTLAGKPEHLYAYKGQVVILHRWGTWCAPCVLEMPAFQKLYDRYRNDPKVRFVVVASMNSPSEVAAFAGQHHYDLPFYIADDQDTGGVKVSTFPTTMIYDKRSDIRMVQTGVTDWARPDIMARIELLKQE
jgi:thiol-disulfide isomerase/thioredoxin